MPSFSGYSNISERRPRTIRWGSDVKRHWTETSSSDSLYASRSIIEDLDAAASAAWQLGIDGL